MHINCIKRRLVVKYIQGVKTERGKFILFVPMTWLGYFKSVTPVRSSVRPSMSNSFDQSFIKTWSH